MWLIPAFQPGVLNAWVPILAFLFLHLVAMVAWPILGYDLKGVFRKSATFAPRIKAMKRIYVLWAVMFALVLGYSIFLPLQIGTVWFYTGLGISVLGLIVYEVAWINWAQTPLDAPVTEGVYRFSRHPVYLAIFLLFIGVSVASASWLFLALNVGLIIAWRVLAIAEEQFCLETYGDIYREYTKRTPRWIGAPKKV